MSETERTEQSETSHDGLHIRDAFIVLGSEAVRIGAPSASSLTHSYVYGLGAYLPRWARRPRLRRLRPLLRRAEVVIALWRWSGGKPGAEYAFFYPHPYRLGLEIDGSRRLRIAPDARIIRA